MLECLAIFSAGGLILYQYNASPSLVKAEDGVVHGQQAISSTLIQSILIRNSDSNKTYHIAGGLTFCWLVERTKDDKIIVAAIYPDILFEGPRQYLRKWCEGLVQMTLKEYMLIYKNAQKQHPTSDFIRPDPSLFDDTFENLLSRSKGKVSDNEKPPETINTTSDVDASSVEQENNTTTTPSSSSPSPPTESTTTTAAASATTTKKGKEKRTWNDGNAKVTASAMAELDMSKDKANVPVGGGGTTTASEETRLAYLPNEMELQQLESEKAMTETDTTSYWGTGVNDIFQQLIGSKVLQDTDLDRPLKAVEEMFIHKNVAREIAQALCESCRQRLIGKKLNSLYRVQTAIQQALEVVLTKLLDTKIDLLRNVLSRQSGSSDLSGLLGSLGRVPKKPYVITVMGINGIGKTTSLAKLAWYFQQNRCSPMLVAGDTFRSGAVEQLKVHANCLDVPFFSEGYSKDPSSVAKAAIQKATEEGYDVVLIDTAGRMQNNVPLMKALSKLMQENRPDFCILVCEALVGHDGLSQFKMFRQALGNRGIDGLILTKYDTVSDKVGAALTLTHETGCPIIFCGTGQKYHHLKKLSVPHVIKSLFS